MEITCWQCHQIWQVQSGHFLAAKLKFAFGADAHAFPCPNCQAKNVVTKHEFEISDPQKPVTDASSEMHAETETAQQTHARRPGGDPPTNPVPGPERPSRQYQGVVLVRDLRVRRDHHLNAETVANLKKGEHFTILDTWINGEDIWAQLGPERWVEVEDKGEALINLAEE